MPDVSKMGVDAKSQVIVLADERLAEMFRYAVASRLGSREKS
jgi:hypothetical protein